MSERCETCRYWSLYVKPVGHCRRFPPRYEPVTDREVFPLLRPDSWCGEWRAREAQASWLEREP